MKSNAKRIIQFSFFCITILLFGWLSKAQPSRKKDKFNKNEAYTVKNELSTSTSDFMEVDYPNALWQQNLMDNVVEVLTQCPSQVLHQLKLKNLVPSIPRKLSTMESDVLQLQKQLSDLITTLADLQPEKKEQFTTLSQLWTTRLRQWKTNSLTLITKEATALFDFFLKTYFNPSHTPSSSFSSFMGSNPSSELKWVLQSPRLENAFKIQIQENHISFLFPFPSLLSTLTLNQLEFKEELQTLISPFEMQFHMHSLKVLKFYFTKAILSHCHAIEKIKKNKGDGGFHFKKKESKNK